MMKPSPRPSSGAQHPDDFGLGHAGGARRAHQQRLGREARIGAVVGSGDAWPPGARRIASLRSPASVAMTTR